MQESVKENNKRGAEEKKIALSLVQPSGDLTLGNYLGAIRQFVDMQDEYDCYFGVANLHAITVIQEPAKLRKRSLEVLAYYIAAGVDPEKVHLFIQSQVPQHAELAWVLNSISSIGQLQRMTQFKDKAQKNQENLNAALLTYPVLMAADILLYQTDLVPVGADQKQHLEFTRDIAERFNSRYSPTFKLPEPLTPKSSQRIMSLKDPNSKMSKSDPDINAYILMKDDAQTIKRKISRAVTDSLANFSYNDDQAGLKNLINIYMAFSEKSADHIVDEFKSKGYADFKNDLADLIISYMEPIRKLYLDLLNDKAYLASIYEKGAEDARRKASRTMSKVYRKVGFVQ